MNLPDIFNRKKAYLSNIMETNLKSQKYGLILKEKDALEILKERESVLLDQGRVELDVEVTVRIIEFLHSSPYVNKYNYSDAVIGLQEIFYYLKTETDDKISDNKLLKTILKLYNKPCNGSLDLLKGREADKIIKAVRNHQDLPVTAKGVFNNE